jgi:hypothetical protein
MAVATQQPANTRWECVHGAAIAALRFCKQMFPNRVYETSGARYVTSGPDREVSLDLPRRITSRADPKENPQ